MEPRAPEFETLHEIVAAARLKLNDYIWDYLVGGTETETTLRRNRMALDQIALRPRVCVDVSRIAAGSSFLGHEMRLPVILAPVGSLESFDPGAGVTVARAAKAFGVPMMLSSVNRRPIEEIAGVGGTPMYQLYVRGGDDFVDREVERAAAAGFVAFCITVDTAVYSRRERDIAKRFAKPWRADVDAGAAAAQAAFNWRNVAHYKRRHRVPLILKGIATGEDARIAVEHGVDAIYVSNHGGRQLDHGRGAIEVLDEVLDVTRGKAQVIVDGGFCRGTDLVKAIAMGADAVGLGRLYLYGMAARGEAGIVRVLEILENETTSALGLIGAPRLADLGRQHLHFGAAVTQQPGALSAFPLLDPAIRR